MLHRSTLAFAALVATGLLTAAAPKPQLTAAKEPAPSGLAPPAEDAVIVGSCKVSKEQCVDYEGSFPGGEAQGRCKKLKGAWRDESCSADGRVGTCTVRDTGTDKRVMARWYAPATEKAVRAECKKQPRAVYMPR